MFAEPRALPDHREQMPSSSQRGDPHPPGTTGAVPRGQSYEQLRLSHRRVPRHGSRPRNLTHGPPYGRPRRARGAKVRHRLCLPTPPTCKFTDTPTPDCYHPSAVPHVQPQDGSARPPLCKTTAHARLCSRGFVHALTGGGCRAEGVCGRVTGPVPAAGRSSRGPASPPPLAANAHDRATP